MSNDDLSKVNTSVINADLSQRKGKYLTTWVILNKNYSQSICTINDGEFFFNLFLCNDQRDTIVTQPIGSIQFFSISELFS